MAYRLCGGMKKITWISAIRDLYKGKKKKSNEKKRTIDMEICKTVGDI